MLRMTTLIQQVRVGFLARKNRHQNLALGVVLAKMPAKSALSVVNCLHKILLLFRGLYPVQTPSPGTLLPEHRVFAETLRPSRTPRKSQPIKRNALGNRGHPISV
jgi:hypothetical protein